MATYLFYDTIRLNASAGGVLNVSEVLLESMRDAPGHEVQPISERHPHLYAAARRLKISRFILDTLLYNVHLVRGWLHGERVYSLFPNYFLPFSLLAPFGRHRDSIVVVHDVQYKSYPQYFSARKRLWLDWNLHRVARSAADVVFISRSSQEDFERHFRRCEHPAVIFNPVDAGAVTASADRTAAPDGRYLIAAYHYYPHKNFEGILKLFVRMKRQGLVDYLDITGNGAKEVERMISAMAPAFRGCVRHRGLVSRDELLRLYRGATAFISLSTFEGFNLSAAEAATLGVPLLLSDLPVHRELFAGYAFFIGNEFVGLGNIERYLAAHQRTRPAWSLSRACTPGAVAASYLRLKRGDASLARATP
ncbi:Glycosyl transferases group 1 [Variovorax boronicumulans]|uniref:glycosyltransferase n=1 Tax=Variovorax boronicumulans TaxID=436515 RepID=UPI000BB2FB59|nr:glycosyltransferase [Variovorax boronicumulans]PBI95176.1 Glycosyl transferases group 1 [Variovorax boronicumulans]